MRVPNWWWLEAAIINVAGLAYPRSDSLPISPIPPMSRRNEEPPSLRFVVIIIVIIIIATTVLYYCLAGSHSYMHVLPVSPRVQSEDKTGPTHTAPDISINFRRHYLADTGKILGPFHHSRGGRSPRACRSHWLRWKEDENNVSSPPSHCITRSLGVEDS